MVLDKSFYTIWSLIGLYQKRLNGQTDVNGEKRRKDGKNEREKKGAGVCKTRQRGQEASTEGLGPGLLCSGSS